MRALLNKSTIILTSIILISIAIKLVLFLAFYHHPQQLFRYDTISYLTPAKSLLTTGSLLNQHHQPIFFRTPGYPIFVAGVFYLFGQHLSAVIIVQILLSSVLIIAAYSIAKQLFSIQAGLLAALFVAVDYLLTGFTYMLLTDMLFAVLLSGAYAYATKFFTSDQCRYGLIFLMGLLLALASLTRPVSYFLLLPTAIGILAYLLLKRSSFKQIALVLLLLLLPNIILLGSWQVRNKVQLGTFRFSGITGAHGMTLFFPENYKLYQSQYHKPYHAIGISDDIKMLIIYPTATMKQFSHGLIRVTMGTERALVQFFGKPSDNQVFNQTKHYLIHFKIRKMLSYTHQHITQWFPLLYLYGALLINITLYLLCIICLYSIYKSKPSLNKLFAHLFLIGCVLYFLLLSSNASSWARYRVPFQLIIDCYAAGGATWLLGAMAPCNDAISGV